MRSRFILKHCFAGRRRLRQQPCLQRHPTGTNSWSGCRPAMICALAPARPAARSPGRRPPWLLRCTRWPGTATARSDYPRGRWPRESAAPAQSCFSRRMANGALTSDSSQQDRRGLLSQSYTSPTATTQRHQTPATTADQHHQHHQHHQHNHNGHPVPRDDRR